MFEEWKKLAGEHYLYYNLLEKMIVGIDLNEREMAKRDQHQ
jgi:hypothetical protein